MKNFLIFIASAMLSFDSFAAGFAFSTNDAINVPDQRATNNLWVVSKQGNERVAGNLIVDGTVSAQGTNIAATTASATIGTITVQSNSTINANLSGIKTLTAGTATIQTNATVGGTLNVTGVETLSAQPAWNAAELAVGTNSAVIGISIKVNGTNYVINVGRPNGS